MRPESETSRLPCLPRNRRDRRPPRDRRPALPTAGAILLLAAHPAAAEPETLEPQVPTLRRIVVTAAPAGNYRAPTAGTATRLALAPHETPQSVSIITRTLLDDFGLDDLNDALETGTGVTVERVETDRTYYTARGFDITNFQIDGVGVPLEYGHTSGSIDTAMFERIEIVRGATGLMSGVGNPSATVNLIRKRPTAETAVTLAATAGSWDERRVVADASAALGTPVRGRIVVARDTAESWLRDYAHTGTTVHAVLEADLGDTTRASAGFGQQRSDADSPMWGALPLYYSDGTATHYDRSASTSADWSYWNHRDREAFLEVEQHIGARWTARAVYTRTERDEDAELFYMYGVPEPAGETGLNGWASAYGSVYDRDLVDASVQGAFDLFGHVQQLVFGMNHARARLVDHSLYDYANGFPVIGDFTQWTGDYPRPAFVDDGGGSDFRDRQSAVYAATRLEFADDWAFVGGARVVDWRSRGSSYGVSQDARVRLKWIPYAGVVWDVVPALALYASYTETFRPQSELDASLQRLAPASGRSLEAGAKWSLADGRVDASLAVFSTRHDNVAEWSGFVGTESVYAGRDYRSRGVEFELVGEPLAGLQVAGGLTWLGVEGDDGRSARHHVPRRMLRIAASYRLPSSPLHLGASLRWQDDIERRTLTYASGSIRQPGYALLGAFARWQITDEVSAAINVDNLTNRRYVASLNWEQGYYGAPRSCRVSLTWKL